MNVDIDFEKEIVQERKDYVTRYDPEDMLATFIALSGIESVRAFCEQRKISMYMTQRMFGSIREITMHFET